MKSTTKLVLFWSIAGFALAAGFYFTIAKNNQSVREAVSPNGSKNGGGGLPKITQEIQDWRRQKKIIFLKKDGSAKTIYKSGLDGEAAQEIYSDSRSEAKIKALAGIANDGKRIYLLMTTDQDDGLTLAELSTESAPTLKLLKANISGGSIFQLSPTGGGFVEVVFSNAEKEFGSTVSLTNFSDEKKETLFHSQETINIINFSADAKKLAVVKPGTSGGSQIIILDLQSKETQGLYSTDELIASVDFESDKTVFAQMPTGQDKANQAEIYSVDSEGKNVTRLTDNNFNESQISLDPDSKYIAYVKVSFPDGKVIPEAQGNIAVADLKNRGETILGQGYGVIGWAD